MKTVCTLLAIAIVASACDRLGDAALAIDNQPEDSSAFARDVAFLRRYDPALLVLERDSVALVASAKYQGKVFTTTTGNGESQGFINYEAFDVDPPAAHINAYGGEQRLWVGPEGGPQSIFFPPDTPFTSAVWQTPAPIDHEPWTITEATNETAGFAKEARFESRAGQTFDARLERRVRLMSAADIAGAFPDSAIGGLAAVGYSTDNAIVNVGDDPWGEETGTVSLWLLDILPAGGSVVAVLPYRGATPETLDTTNAGYFGATPPDRLQVVDSAVLFRGDGAEVGKVGLPVAHTTGRLGSVDLERGVLTVIDFDYDPNALYQGMEWRDLEDPYTGDAVTSYNNGAAPARPSFYELESVAPAAFLAPGGSAEHRHDVYHFVGSRAEVLAAAEVLLGVGEEEVVGFLGSKE